MIRAASLSNTARSTLMDRRLPHHAERWWRRRGAGVSVVLSLVQSGRTHRPCARRRRWRCLARARSVSPAPGESTAGRGRRRRRDFTFRRCNLNHRHWRRKRRPYDGLRYLRTSASGTALSHQHNRCIHPRNQRGSQCLPSLPRRDHEHATSLTLPQARPPPTQSRHERR